MRVVNPRTFFICKYYSLTDDWWVRKELDGRQHLEALLTIFLVDHIGNCTTWHFQTAKDHWRWTKNHHQPISNCCQHGERFWVGVLYSFDNTYETVGKMKRRAEAFYSLLFRKYCPIKKSCYGFVGTQLVTIYVNSKHHQQTFIHESWGWLSKKITVFKGNLTEFGMWLWYHY